PEGNRCASVRGEPRKSLHHNHLQGFTQSLVYQIYGWVGSASCDTKCSTHPTPNGSALLVTQTPYVGGHRLDVIIANGRATFSRHRHAALGLLLGHTLGDLGNEFRIGAIAMDPHVIRQVGASQTLGVLAVAGIAETSLMENLVALVHQRLGGALRHR